MELQKCGGCLSCLLIPLALWSIVINILLYFPDGKILYASSNNLTNYVWYFEGICFSGIMMLMLAAFLIILDRDAFHQCCQSESCTKTYRKPNIHHLWFCTKMTMEANERKGHRFFCGIAKYLPMMTACLMLCKSFISAVLALLGIAFSGYSLIISTLGLVQGPFCKTPDGWEYIFKNTAGRYLLDHSTWSACSEPAFIVEWNIILFSILIALSGLQILICLLKVTAELKRILCGSYPVFVQPALT